MQIYHRHTDIHWWHFSTSEKQPDLLPPALPGLIEPVSFFKANYLPICNFQCVTVASHSVKDETKNIPLERKKLCLAIGHRDDNTGTWEEKAQNSQPV